MVGIYRHAAADASGPVDISAGSAANLRIPGRLRVRPLLFHQLHAAVLGAAFLTVVGGHGGIGTVAKHPQPRPGSDRLILINQDQRCSAAGAHRSRGYRHSIDAFIA